MLRQKAIMSIFKGFFRNNDDVMYPKPYGLFIRREGIYWKELTTITNEIQHTLMTNYLV